MSSKLRLAAFAPLPVFLFALLLQAPGARAEDPENENAAPEKITRDELCKYDRYCSNALNGDGTVKRPNRALLKLMDEYSGTIADVASRLGVDPRAVAGAILAENSMNVGVEDSVQNYFAKVGITKVNGKEFSFGLGQINHSAADAAEPYMAKKEGRAERSFDEITRRLTTQEGSIEYAAGILLQAQEEYKKAGIDISKRPEILTTLYNLGKIKERAAESGKAGAKPRPNYFGFFVMENLPEIDRIVTLGQTRKGKDLLKDDFRLHDLRAREKVEMFAGLPSCRETDKYYTESGKYYEYMKKKSQKRFPVAHEFSGSYEILQRGIDCDAEDWLLIRNEAGLAGWVKKNRLEAATDFVKVSQKKDNCEMADPACAKTLKKLDPEWDGKAEGSTLTFRISASEKYPADGERSWKGGISGCLDDSNSYGQNAGRSSSSGLTGAKPASGTSTSTGTAVSTQASAPPAPLPPGWAEVSKNEMIRLRFALEEKKAEIARGMGVSSWDSENNILRGKFYGHLSEDCLRVKCFIYGLPELKTFLATDFRKLKGFKSFADELEKVSRLRTSQDPSGTSYGSNVTFGEVSRKVKESCAGFAEAKDQGVRDSYRELIELLDGQEPGETAPYMSFWNYDLYCKSLTDAYRAAQGQAPASDQDIVCLDRFVYTGNIYGTSNLASLQGVGEELSDSIYTAQAMQNLSSILSSIRQAVSAAQQAKNPQLGAGAEAPQERKCPYDPFKTLDRINAIVGNECVAHVLVPDPFLYNSAEHQQKLILAEFPDDGQYKVVLKADCGRVL